ncbi:MAG: CRTAC1 family protein [Gemmatimonadetes bacterium]|nr:CRTAC1 family protein [Gemmatimonadota bacterium]
MLRRRNILEWPLWMAACISCNSPAAVPSSLRFADATVESAIGFRHTNGATGNYNYPETFGAGVAWLDADSDGWLDLYFIDGGSLAPDENPAQTSAAKNRLYRNMLGDGRAGFEDVTDQTNAAGQGYGMGVASADVDANGEVDIYVTNVGPNELLLQFEQKFVGRETAADPRWGTACAFSDLDRDGDLDLVAVNYVHFDPLEPHACQRGSIQTYCDPEVYAAQTDVLYRNMLQESGRFELIEHSEETGSTIPGRSLGLAIADLDLDGDSDLYVANDGQQNLLYRNDSADGRISLTETGLAAGIQFNADGMAEAGMGVDVGDVNGDSAPDLIVTNFSRETNTLYQHVGKGLLFRDATRAFGLARLSFLPLGFGVNLFDADLDGDLDIFSAHGHVLDKATQIDSSLTYAQPDGLFLNHQGRFVDQSSSLGLAYSNPRVSRSSAVADYDRDGDLDIVVTTVGGMPRLLRNDQTLRSHWLEIELVAARPGNRRGWGARVVVTTRSRVVTRQLQSGGSYLSSPPGLLHFGLGDDELEVVDVTVHWPGGIVQTWNELSVDQRHSLQQTDAR